MAARIWTVPVAHRIRPPLRALFAGLTIVALVGVAGCGGGSSQKDRFATRLQQLGLSSETASCVTDHLYSSLDSGEVDELFSAAKKGGGNQAAIPLPLRQKLYAAIVPCAPAGASTSGGVTSPNPG
jgi:hypothetical protein